MPDPTHRANHLPSPADAPPAACRRPWVSPLLEELPPLTRLTLQSGGPIPGDGDTSGGGSTVFS
jgi:hypothetical protein